MQPSCRLGNMEGIDIDRLVWIEGHTESDGLHAYFSVGYTGQRMRKRMVRKSGIENDFDLLIEAAKRLCETQFDEDSDSDASKDDGYVPLGVEVDTAISFLTDPPMRKRTRKCDWSVPRRRGSFGT